MIAGAWMVLILSIMCLFSTEFDQTFWGVFILISLVILVFISGIIIFEGIDLDTLQKMLKK